MPSNEEHTPLKPLTEYERRSAANLIHGHAKKRTYSPTYSSWQSMLARCRYLKRDNDKKYCGRGIKVCKRWENFALFLKDMGERPEGKTLDRYPNNNGDYEPGNCRWATPVEQARNRRNKRLTFETAVEVAVHRLRGVPCRVLAEEYGISESLPREIAKGRTWPDALAAAKEILGDTDA